MRGFIEDAANPGNVIAGNLFNIGDSGTVTTYLGNIAGVAAQATRLETARTITLDTDITGSVSFDGTADVTINAEIAENAVTSAEIAENAVTSSELADNAVLTANVMDKNITAV